MISQGEAKMRAASLALQAVSQIEALWSDDPDWPAIGSELRLIERRLRRDAVGGDKIMLRQMEKPTARQVKPTGRAARAIEAAAKARGKP